MLRFFVAGNDGLAEAVLYGSEQSGESYLVHKD